MTDERRPTPRPPGEPRQKWLFWNLISAVCAILMLGLFSTLWRSAQVMESVPYSTLEEALAAGRVDHVVVSDRQILAYLKSSDASGKQVLAANRVEPELADRLTRFKVSYSRDYDSGWLQQIISWAPAALMLFAFWYFLIRGSRERAGMGLLSFGRSRAKVLLERNTGVTFADVAGVDEAKQELQEVVDFLKNPQRCTIQRPTEERFLSSREELQNRMAVLLGGRAAELLVLGNPSTGAADDLAKATQIAREIVTRHGMHRKLGLASYETDRPTFVPSVAEPLRSRLYSEETAREIDCAVRELLADAFAMATAVLTRGRRVLERGAQALLQSETLAEPELAKLQEELAALQPPGNQTVATSAA